MSRREREAEGLPVSPIGGELYFNRLGVGLGLNDPETGERLSRTVFGPRGSLPAEPWQNPTLETLSQEDRALVDAMTRRFGVSPEEAFSILSESGQFEPSYVEEPTPPGFGSAVIEPRLEQVNPESPLVAQTWQFLQPPPDRGEEEQPVAGAEEPAAEEDPAAEEEEQPVAGAEDGEGAPAQVDPDAILAAMQEDLTALGEQDDQTLRERYEDRLQLFQDVFGSDEQTARDRSMALAMIGLAIAAGQSPDAVTNIASGALAGLQSMSAQEERRRERGREARGMALESAMGELAAQRDAQAEAAAFEQEANLRRELAAIGAGGRDGAGGVNLATGNAILQAVQEVAQQLIETGEANNMTEAEPIARQLVLQRLGNFGIGATSALPTAAPEDATPEELALLGGGA